MMSAKFPHITHLIYEPKSKQRPNKTSSEQIEIAKNKARDDSHSTPKTSKYSWSLYENPKGSFNLRKPEKINSHPTKKTFDPH